MHCNFSTPVLIRALPPLLVTEFILGLVGNGLALFIFCFHLRPWKSSTVLLFNLALSDFMLILALPLRVNYYLSGNRWMFGGTLCNLCLFMLEMNRSGSTFFLMAIALDRYMRVVHPHHPLNSLSAGKARLGAIVLWLVPITMTAPVFSLQHINTTHCTRFMVDTESRRNLSWYTFTLLFSFYVPLLVILYCTFHIISHLRRRQLAHQAKFKKALYFIVVVVVLFIICFLPSNITLLAMRIKMLKEFKCADMEQLSTVTQIAINLTYLNSALDPVVYYFSSPAFKNIGKKALHLPQVETGESTDRKTRDTGSQLLSKL
ncbi:hydroxycarboxylic acid receptor 2-like [Fundulus heteroclitus]|uniref:hydroxycarboxylic acid receptor 2-like n=1 Tax=Fundulus heteroclitus TaxID=8078 RepID=UPI00165B9CBA|nr:hydroxycarboxylic acid receptor 2-like [Fundulus heteroclitus]